MVLGENWFGPIFGFLNKLGQNRQTVYQPHIAVRIERGGERNVRIEGLTVPEV